MAKKSLVLSFHQIPKDLYPNLRFKTPIGKEYCLLGCYSIEEHSPQKEQDLALIQYRQIYTFPIKLITAMIHMIHNPRTPHQVIDEACDSLKGINIEFLVDSCSPEFKFSKMMGESLSIVAFTSETYKELLKKYFSDLRLYRN